MILNKFLILVFLLLAHIVAICQEITIDKSDLTPSTIFKHNVTYGLSDFCCPLEKYGITYIPLVIRFESENQFRGSSGKGYVGEYMISDSNIINFSSVETTLQCVIISINGGITFSPYLFMDSLLNCDNFKLEGNEVRLYKGKQFKVAIKPYHELFTFPDRSNCIANYIKEVKVDMSIADSEFIIIDSEISKNEMGVIIYADSVDFGIHNLLIVKNYSLQGNESKEFRKQVKQHKKKSKIYAIENKDELFPVSYAKLNYDSISNVRYLDIINTYNSSNSYDIDRRGKYSGFLVEKADSEEIKLKINYIE